MCMVATPSLLTSALVYGTNHTAGKCRHYSQYESDVGAEHREKLRSYTIYDRLTLKVNLWVFACFFCKCTTTVTKASSLRFFSYRPDCANICSEHAVTGPLQRFPALNKR